MKLYFKIFLFFIFIITNESFAQIKLDNIFTYEDGISYSTVLPVNYNKNKKYILAIGLHGLFSDGSRMVNPFSYYSRYMNIILVCPDGNFTDNGRNGVKWGYDKSDKYILNLVELIKTKYKVYDDVFLFGFSQGGNQGLQTALTNPDIFRYFAGLSGGYTSLTDKQISTAGKINILFISGDTGEGEAFTKREMDNRFQVLKRYNPYAIRKVYPGMRHEVTPEEAFYMFDWLMNVNQKDRSTHIIKEDYYKFYLDSANALTNAKYQESIQYAYNSIEKNKIFAPSYFNLISAFFGMQTIPNFKKYFFQTLELYSAYDFFDVVPLLNLIENIKLSDVDFLLKEKFLEFFQTKMNEHEAKLSPLFKGEVYLLIAELYIISHNPDLARASFKKALSFYSQIPSKNLIYLDGQVKKKILYITEYIKELEVSGK
ncbi:MAG TPA: alpha/beta hydrolase-fold protein [Leptospiraceae bacterium]|nr:alpha/beta hydrolase-fold protein [Leptospiraceae bacterium]HMX32421.1 alpha/beta hydrolase-fold protein [Leptospiraceae bacterium]HMY33664.1 alpha/beta hydrolase-fold protein [Leptospiraceae bacterium]HMZ65215.1 alpha/beta hydrolase-fold protein [Leptospiraceae bacterium]HNA06997.1 alpha/beta hydrolase-fold protein [Leptospiraceae bacterium]